MNVDRTKLSLSVTLGQGFIATVVEGVGNAAHADALAGIAEGLAAAHQEHIVVGVTGHGGLIRRFKGGAEFLAEIHSKVGKIFEHDAIVLGSQRTDDAQLVFVEAHPTRIVRIAIDNGGNATALQVTFQLRAQALPSIFIHVEGLKAGTHHDALLLLHRKTGVDKQNGVFLQVGLHGSHKGGKSSLHASTYGHTAFGLQVHTHKGFQKARSLAFEFGRTVDVGIETGYTVGQGLALRFNAISRSRQTGHSHFHLHKLQARGFLGLLGDGHDFANRGTTEVFNTQLADGFVDKLARYGCWLHYLAALSPRSKAFRLAATMASPLRANTAEMA